MKSELSARELAVLGLATQGYTDDMIARELGITKGTVNSYWVRIRGKTGHYSRTELVARYVQANADAVHLKDQNQAAEAAAQVDKDNKKLLGQANAEIARLQKLLAAKEEA